MGEWTLPLNLCFAALRGDDLSHQLLKRGLDPILEELLWSSNESDQFTLLKSFCLDIKHIYGIIAVEEGVRQVKGVNVFHLPFLQKLGARVEQISVVAMIM